MSLVVKIFKYYFQKIFFNVSIFITITYYILIKDYNNLKYFLLYFLPVIFFCDVIFFEIQILRFKNFIKNLKNSNIKTITQIKNDYLDINYNSKKNKKIFIKILNKSIIDEISSLKFYFSFIHFIYCVENKIKNNIDLVIYKNYNLNTIKYYKKVKKNYINKILNTFYYKLILSYFFGFDKYFYSFKSFTLDPQNENIYYNTQIFNIKSIFNENI